MQALILELRGRGAAPLLLPVLAAYGHALDDRDVLDCLISYNETGDPIALLQ